MSSTTNNPAVSKSQQFSPQPPPLHSLSSTSYEALAVGLSHHRDVGNPRYRDYDGQRSAAAYNDYKPEVVTSISQLIPLYASQHLHHSISAYQHQLQQQQQQQQTSNYTKTQNTAHEQSNAQGKSDRR